MEIISYIILYGIGIYFALAAIKDRDYARQDRQKARIELEMLLETKEKAKKEYEKFLFNKSRMDCIINKTFMHNIEN